MASSGKFKCFGYKIGVVIKNMCNSIGAKTSLWVQQVSSYRNCLFINGNTILLIFQIGILI